MSRIAFTGNALGTGTVTMAAPNTNTDQTVTLPDQTGTLYISGGDIGTPSGGNGSNLTNLNASNLSSGTVATARLASGTANSTTYLRGDQTWATVTGGVTSITAGNGLTGGTITSSGTIALDYYTGTAANNTSYPVGSYLSADYTGASSSIINSAQTLWVATSDNAFTAYNPGGRTVMAGTWRSRGKTSGDPWFLVQRTA